MGARCAFAARGGAAGIDGISYLDVAHAYLRHDWHTAINGYWGPLYSWLLALAMYLTPTGAMAELSLARAVNFVVFVLAVYAFGASWRAIAKRTLESADAPNSVPGLYPEGWIVVGYALFVTASAWYIGSLTPDLAVAAIVFAVVAFLLRLEDGKRHAVAAYAAWGALLALGYYAKVVLFYFGMFLLLAMAVRHLKIKSYIRPAVALITFVVLISPFAFLISRSLGRFTIGETGRLAYAWLAAPSETKTWMTGRPDSAPMPFYPGRTMHTRPMVFEVPHIPGVTYAPWYDASRFDVRSHARFSLSEQLKRMVGNLKPISGVVVQSEGTLLLALIILALYAPLNFLRGLGRSWFYSLPILAVVSMYVLVFLVWRYMLAFSPLLWGTALAAVTVPVHLRATVRPVILAGIIVFALNTVPGLTHFLFSSDHTGQREVAIANSLSSYGIGQGNLVASVGEGESATWAHLAGVSIDAEIWATDGANFWTSSPSDQDEIVRDILKTGARAIVWRRNSEQLCQLPWRSLANSSGCILTQAPAENIAR